MSLFSSTQDGDRGGGRLSATAAGQNGRRGERQTRAPPHHHHQASLACPAIAPHQASQRSTSCFVLAGEQNLGAQACTLSQRPEVGSVCVCGGGESCVAGSLQTPPTTRPVYKHSCCHIFAMHPKATSSERRCKKREGGGGGRWSRHLERTGRLVFETVNSLNPYCESFMQNISGLLTLGLVRPPQIEKERGEGRGKPGQRK